MSAWFLVVVVPLQEHPKHLPVSKSLSHPSNECIISPLAAL